MMIWWARGGRGGGLDDSRCFGDVVVAEVVGAVDDGKTNGDC